MKKYSVILVLFLSNFIANAQEIQGKAEYLVKYNMGTGILGSDSEVKSEADAAFNQQVAEAMKKGSEKRYILSFNKNECLYEQQQELEKPDAGNDGEFAVTIDFSDSGKKYLNSKEKKKITEKDIMGKEFIIVDELQPLNWKLINETKKIGQYTFLKAEINIPVSKKQKEEYQDYLKQQEIKASLFKMKEPKEKLVVAWYTTEIPVSFGSENYYGLPGLILEIQNEEMIILCTKVTLSKGISKIKIPNTGKKVTQIEFDDAEKKMYDKMKDGEGTMIKTED